MSYASDGGSGSGLGGTPAPPAHGAKTRQGDTGVVAPEMRLRKWFMFAVEKVVSANSIAFNIYTLDVCFNDYELVPEDDATEATEIAELMKEDASDTYLMVMITLIFGLVVEILSAVVLSRAYRTPLDIKSVHKIPTNDLRTFGGSMMIFFVAPFSWALIYLFGGFASVSYGIHSSCNGKGGRGLDVYLAVSGVLMILLGLVLLAASVVAIWFACGSPFRCTDQCCAAVRKVVNKRILSKGTLFELFWIFQGVVWSYRTGDPTETILAVMVVSLVLLAFCVGGRVAVRYVFSQTVPNKW